tara:strand:+ start:2603 stop:3784 length:1182 start_codon:yes stop_codon:yes gene_type:complete
VIVELLKIIFFIFIKIIPKKKNLFVFGDRAGLRFADNSRHLFIYLNKNHKEFRCIWITKSLDIYNVLRGKNYEVYYSTSLKGIYYCLIAEWHLFNFVEDDINRNITKFSKCILLWHGVLPKKVKNLKHKKNLINNFIYKKIKKFFIYPNKSLAQGLLNRFPEFKYELLISNLPRNKILEDNTNYFTTDAENQIIEKINISKKKIYGYFPTWREDGIEIFRDVKNLDKLDELDKSLKKTNSMILLKKHMNSEIKDGDRRYNPMIENIIDKLKNYETFILADYDTDLNSILKKCDCLISDYSGVVFDFLYLDRPIILYVPDYDEFSQNNGFELNIVERKIANIVTNIDDLIKLVSRNEENDILNSEMSKNKIILKDEVFSPRNNGVENILNILKK